MRKYKWFPYREGTAGFFFDDPILTDEDELIGTVWVRWRRCQLYKSTTKTSLWWKEGDPVAPIYYAVGSKGIFYDKKTVGPFWQEIIRAPV